MKSEKAVSPDKSQFAGMGSPHGLLAHQAERFPDNDLLVLPASVRQLWGASRSTWTYSESLAETDTLSRRYAAAGLGAGRRVALMLQNRPEHFFHWLALNSLGASIVPVNPQITPDELNWLLRHSEAELLVRLETHSQVADPAARAVGIPAIAPDGTPPAIGPAVGPVPPDNAAECALIYTSGSTGRPKGCLLSNRYFLSWSDWYAAQGGLVSLR